MDAIEPVEIAVLTWLVCHHTRLYGPIGYCDPLRLRGILAADYADLLKRLREEADGARIGAPCM